MENRDRSALLLHELRGPETHPQSFDAGKAVALSLLTG
jgi:hypothetical protein